MHIVCTLSQRSEIGYLQRLHWNYGVASECMMCVKDAREQKKCKLRKVLMNIAPTEAVHKDGLCAYIDVVAGNELGEYI